MILTGFNAIVAPNAKIVILGSMPGIASLSKTQYYAHPRNSFWFIIESLFSIETNLTYQRRVELLHDNNIALWDVLKNCERPGSLDSAIKKNSMIANDFNAFYEAFPTIKSVFFNGAKSEMEYRKQVVPSLSQPFSQIDSHLLPSTSPAMATLKPLEKLEYWSLIKKKLSQQITTASPPN